MSAEFADIVEYRSLRQLLLPLFLPCFWMALVKTVIITVLPLHVLRLGMSYQDVGLLSACTGLGTTLGNVPAGAIVSKHGPLNGVRLEGACFALSAALLCTPVAQRGWFLPLACASVLAGFAETLGVLCRQTFLGATVPASMRAEVASAMGGVGRYGSLAGPLIGGLVAQHAGPRAVFAIQGGLSLIAVGIANAFLPRVSAAQDLAGGRGLKAKTESLSARSIVAQHWRVMLSVSLFCNLVLFFRKSREVLFSMAGHERGLSQAEVGGMASLSFVVDAIFFPLGGRIMNTWGRTWAGAITLVGGSACLVLLAQPQVPMTVFAVLSGVANASSSGLVLTLGADVAPPECRAEFLGLFRTIARAGDLGAPAILGLVAQALSLSDAILAVAGVSLAGAAWGRCGVRETLRRPECGETPKLADEKAASVGARKGALAPAEPDEGEEQRLRAADAAATVSPMRLGQRLDDEEEG